jgi:hypothetical protein
MSDERGGEHGFFVGVPAARRAGIDNIIYFMSRTFVE